MALPYGAQRENYSTQIADGCMVRSPYGVSGAHPHVIAHYSPSAATQSRIIFEGLTHMFQDVAAFFYMHMRMHVRWERVRHSTHTPGETREAGASF